LFAFIEQVRHRHAALSRQTRYFLKQASLHCLLLLRLVSLLIFWSKMCLLLLVLHLMVVMMLLVAGDSAMMRLRGLLHGCLRGCDNIVVHANRMGRRRRRWSVANRSYTEPQKG